MEREFRITLHGRLCVYCGETATELDHFPPKCHTPHGFLLPACGECNRLAGAAWPDHFEQRASMVRDKLRKRYRKAIGTPEWSRGEIRALGWTLRTGVLKWRTTMEVAKRRVAWNALSYLVSIDRNNDFVPIFAEDAFLEANGLPSSKRRSRVASKPRAPAIDRPISGEDLFAW